MPAGRPGSPGGREGSVWEVARLFLRLGCTSFGGPAAHIAMLRGEVVERRRWLDDQEFLDLVGAVNLLPGPNSTELAIHLGRRRAGWAGLLAAGVCFIGPAALLVLGLAWLYVRYGTTPNGEALLYGVKPVIIAVVAQAVVMLVRPAVKGLLLALLGVAGAGLYLAGVNELALLAGGGLLACLVGNRSRLRPPRLAALLLPLGLVPPASAALQARTEVDLERLFWFFLKVGAVLYGSGYVLLAFLRRDLVGGHGWLSDQQLVDAVAVGQLTPGPVFTTATFVGYLLAGLPGAALATVGIFLPSFVFVAALGPLVARARRSPWTSALLDGVNVVALGLLVGVTLQLAGAALVDPVTVLLAVAALLALLRWRVNSAWLVAAGALVGLLRVALA